MENHSSYVQQLAYIAWAKTEFAVDNEVFSQSITDLIHQNAILYQSISDGLTRYHLNFLKALLQGRGSEMSTSEVIRNFDLGSSANVVRIKQALLKKEIIDISDKTTTLCDPVFGLWLKREMKIL